MNSVSLRHRAALSTFSYGLLVLGLARPSPAQSCQLNSPSGKIKHVVYIEFDHVHFTCDHPNVPSDLEQMPNLLNFLEDKGTLDAGSHAVLISHTANDILTTQTGLYSDDTSIFIANSLGLFSGGNAVFPFFVFLLDRQGGRHPACDRHGREFRPHHAGGKECSRSVGAFHPCGMHGRRLFDGEYRA